MSGEGRVELVLGEGGVGGGREMGMDGLLVEGKVLELLLEVC